MQSAKKSDISGTLDTSSWKLFQISELFNVQKGKRLTKADMKDGKIRLYAFIDKWKKDMQKSKIPLPVDKDGNPDYKYCLLYTSPSPRDRTRSRMPSSA